METFTCLVALNLYFLHGTIQNAHQINKNKNLEKIDFSTEKN